MACDLGWWIFVFDHFQYHIWEVLLEKDAFWNQISYRDIPVQNAWSDWGTSPSGSGRIYGCRLWHHPRRRNMWPRPETTRIFCHGPQAPACCPSAPPADAVAPTKVQLADQVPKGDTNVPCGYTQKGSLTGPDRIATMPASFLQCEFVFKGHQIVVPVSLKKEQIEVTHAMHIGIEACIWRARESLWWSWMSAELKQYIGKYDICLAHR